MNQAGESDLPIGLAAPARRALAGAGINRLEQVAQLSEAQIRKLHGMGPKAIRLLREALHERGLSFAGEPETPRE
ncbi:MAG TPA: hypothetical protein VIO36_13005 [Anaerolineaceae bacterium]